MLPFARRLPGGFGRLDNRRFIMVKLGSGGVLPPNTGMERLDCSMQTALVIMAAGLGSRFGGVKQMEGLGPHGEILMEYAAYDAVRAGYDKIVVVVAPGMRQAIDERFGGALLPGRLPDGTPYEVEYAVQDNALLPSFYAVPPERTKPFGTVHALLCAEHVVHEPCCVINADDYYGLDAYRTMYRALQELPETGEAVMVGYLLKNTASLHGTVSRGVCTVKDGWLASVKETTRIQLYPDGSLRDLETDLPLEPESVVSMNYWGFMPSIFPELRAYFERFLRGDGGRALKSECLLPVMVDDLMREGRLEVSVLHSSDKWFGMTYQEDRAVVAEELRKLHENGTYPDSLRV